MSESMVERVARAIYEKRNGHGCKPWSRQPATHREPYMLDARAALSAVLDPSPDMIEAGFGRVLVGVLDRKGNAQAACAQIAVDCYKAMARAALSEAPQAGA